MGRNVCLSIILLLPLLALVSTEQDEFSCHGNHGFFKIKQENERGAILPRSDIYVKIGGDPVKVLCRFNDAFIKPEDVFFKGEHGRVLPHTVLNSSTIEAAIMHTSTTKYRLACVLRRKKKEKTLCRQFVKAGSAPLDIKEEDLHCLSKNYQTLNCTWKYQPNVISTVYKVQHSTPGYTNESPCMTNDAKTMCYWPDTGFHLRDLRDEFYLHLHGSNQFGSIEYTHLIKIPEVVVPDKIPSEVVLTGPKTARVLWNLSFPIDVFMAGLWHQVDYREAGRQQWQLVKLLSHKQPLSSLSVKRDFAVTQALPLANIRYEFRVRLHTMAASFQQDLWSDYDIVIIKTEAMPPQVAPATSTSSFEVVEKLDKRDLYINYQVVDPNFYSGNNFSYKISAFSGAAENALDIQPNEETNAYFKYTLMAFTEYRFRIYPANEKGIGSQYSEVVVPNSDCMPKKTEFFTVIIRNDVSTRSKVFSLYWVPAKNPNQHCPGSSPGIDSYTIFWCKKTYGDRCKEKMEWLDVGDLALVEKHFAGSYDANIALYEKNITGLPDGLHTFGIAAVSGTYSSGIRWSSCIVDESDSPPAPTSVSAYRKTNNTVLLKWDLKCSSLSAVPLGYNINYCKSEIPDFGHCTSEVKSIQLHSPEAKSLVLKQGLEPGTSYIFSISLLSYIGEGMQSRPVKVQIAEKVPTGPARNFRARDVTNSSAHLSWDLPVASTQNGAINKFYVFVSGMRPSVVELVPGQKAPFTFTVAELSAFTKYTIEVAACTSVGCSTQENRASLVLQTLPGVPSAIKNFALDVSNWRLSWQMESCNNPSCEFDLKIPINDTMMIQKRVKGLKFLSLYDIDVQCETKAMTFYIRAKGINHAGQPLYGNWTTSHKKARECPPVPFAWWAIALIGSIGVLLALVSLLIIKFGWSTIKQTITKCTLKIAVPKAMETKEAHIKMTKQPIIRKTNSDNILSNDVKSWPPRTQRTVSVSSEEMHLITSGLSGGDTVLDRHGRNLSGSSDQSSNQDSAVSSESPSVSEPERQLSETLLRQRITDHPYVRHAGLPEKLSEGYVAALSVPSLPQLFDRPQDTLQQSTPNLTGAKCDVMCMPGARRASTGYISMVDSDGGIVSPIPSAALPPLTLSQKNGGMPPYSRHSAHLPFKAEVKNTNWPTSGYVTLAEAGGQAPTLPNNPSYVSAGDPFGGVRQSPELPPEAYCKVGQPRQPSPVVAVSPHQPNPGFKSSPYVAVGDAMRFNTRPEPKVTPYVQLKDTERWAHPVPLPERDERRQVSSAPPECPSGRNPMHRPYTADGPMPKKGFGTPCLSKQSSGYVSQETLSSQDLTPSRPQDQVLVSPKRLLSNVQRPHSLAIPPQSSMV